MQAQSETRLNRKRREARQSRRLESRRRINASVERINNEAPRATFANAKIVRAQKQLDDLKARNPDESNLDVRQKTAYVCRLVALLAIAVIDVLLLGAFLELFLRFQLSNDSPYFPALKVLATLLLVWVETKIAISIQEAKENATEFGVKLPLYIHTALGLIFAVAMTFCVLSLYYTKISNDIEGEIPAAQLLVLVAVGILTFIMHSLTVFDAEGVAAATGYFGYSVNAWRYSRQIDQGESERTRVAMRIEAIYRNTTTLIDNHTTEFPDDPIPAIPLTQVAANLINAVQAGTIVNAERERGDNLNGQAGERVNPANTSPPPDGKPAAEGAAPYAARPQDNDGANQSTADNENAPEPGSGRGNDAAAGNNTDDGEAEYYRNIVEAQIKDAEGEVS